MSLLQGTNSKDRRIGAEGIVRALVNRGAIGLVSTHDLALTDIGGSDEATCTTSISRTNSRTER